MGHANLTNLSKLFVRQLFAKGKVSMRSCVDFAEKNGEELRASEGGYKDRAMLYMGFEDIVRFLLSNHPHDYRKPHSPVIEPVGMTPEQIEVFYDWLDPDTDTGKWECGEDGEGGEYGILNSVQFRFANGWRKRYPNIPILANVTH